MGCCAARTRNAASYSSTETVTAAQSQHCECHDCELFCGAACSCLTPGSAWSTGAKLHADIESVTHVTFYVQTYAVAANEQTDLGSTALT